MKDAEGYFGVSFFNMVAEDIRFLFEFIYGRHFTDDVKFLVDQV
jgi:hypothetical protein